VPWTAGAGDEEAADDEDEEAGVDADDPDAELAAPDVPGAGCEPLLVAVPGAVVPPGRADGASPLPPVPGEEPGPLEGAPRLFASTAGPALPRAPAAGARQVRTWPPRTQLAVALVPRDRIQPGPELARVAEAAELSGGDEERILHGVGGIRGLTQQRPAIGVQRHRVPVVRLGDPARIARHNGGDHVPVLHGHHRSSPTAHQAAQTA
jgi:hypothetical protein